MRLRPPSPPVTDRWPSDRWDTRRQKPFSRSGGRSVDVGAVTGVMPGNRGDAFHQAQGRAAAAERQVGGQVAVQAQRVHRQHGIGGLVRVELRVVRGDEHLGAGYARRGGAPGRRDRSRRACRDRDRIRSAGRMAATGGRSRRAAFRGPGRMLPDLGGARTAGVRHHAVFRVGVGQADRLAAQREQVDQRRAAQRQALRADRALQFRRGAVEIDEDFQRIAAGDQGLVVDPGEVQEQELVGEGEVFGQQAEAGEAAGGPGQQGLVGGKAGRFDAGRGDDRPAWGPPRCRRRRSRRRGRTAVRTAAASGWPGRAGRSAGDRDRAC